MFRNEKNLLFNKTNTNRVQHQIIPITTAIDKISKKTEPIENNMKNNNKFNINNNFTSNNSITIVYQFNYKFDKKCTGLGDFIRGCYFMLQFSDKYNIDINFFINKHHLNKYLVNFIDNSIPDDISNNITFFDKTNATYFKEDNEIDYQYLDIDIELFKYLNNSENIDGNYFIFLTNHPDQKYISKNHKYKIQEILKPTQELKNIVETCMTNLNLNRHKFIVIQIRLDDSAFSNNISINKQHINTLIKYIYRIRVNTTDDIFLISSNNNIKKAILHSISTIKTIFNEIAHTSNDTADEQNVINTLKEFFVMSYSKQIYSFSVYEHGSGFSKWCAITYDIPYVCKHI